MKTPYRKPQRRSLGDSYSTRHGGTILPYGFARLINQKTFLRYERCLFCNKYLVHAYGHYDKKFCNKKCGEKYKRRQIDKPLVWRGVRRPGL